MVFNVNPFKALSLTDPTGEPSNLAILLIQLLVLLVLAGFSIWATLPPKKRHHESEEHYRVQRQKENFLKMQQLSNSAASRPSEDSKYNSVDGSNKSKVELDEHLFPGNPSTIYAVEQIPVITRQELALYDGSSASKPCRTWVSIGGKVFDLGSPAVQPTPLSFCNSIQAAFNSWLWGAPPKYAFLPTITRDASIIYGKELSLAASMRDFNKEIYLTKPLNLEHMDRSNRSAFFAVYNELYISYPIVAILKDPGYDYEKLLNDKNKFSKPNYYW